MVARRVVPDAASCAVERVEFLADAKVPHRVRPAIAASWRRSRESGVAADRVQVPYIRDPDADTPLLRSAEPVLQRLFDKLHATPVSLILTDADGLVLSRRTHDPAFQARLDRILLAPGFTYAERFAGTNGIGTALESGTPTLVFGHEHYAENLETFACAAVPIHDRRSGRVAGVMNLTCRRRDADPLLLTLAETTADQIEFALQADAGLRELEVLHAYRQACRRTSGLVLAVSADAVTVNDRARTELDPADQQAVLAHAGELGARLTSGRRRCVAVTLPSGAPVRLYVHKVDTGGRDDTAGLVVQVRPVDTPHTPVAAVADPPAALAGTSPLLRRAYRAAVASLAAGRWLAVVGEPGVGKFALVQAVLSGRRYHVIDPLADAAWAAHLTAALAGTDPVIVRHAEQAAGLAELLAQPTRAWVAATTSDADAIPAVVGDVVELAPLRLRTEDIGALVPHLLARSGLAALTCSSEALRMLMRAAWPGNVAQLRTALGAITRRTGRIEPADLPPEAHATSRHVLTRLESIERDAIVRALTDAAGDKRAAATALGISRATIYRRIRDYGIVG